MSISNPVNCPICLGGVENPVNYCEDNHESFCQGCMDSYVQSIVGSAFLGTCPIISCPSVFHDKKRRRILLYQKWKASIPHELVAKHTSLASSLLAFLCGGCHSLKSLDLGYEADPLASCYSKLQSACSTTAPSSFNDLNNLLHMFCIGDKSVDETYDEIIKTFFPSLQSADDLVAWETFSNILRAVPDPERRANLHLRYLRDHPRIRTLCCNREHCFKCKTKDFHEGRTCKENILSLDHSIVNCPHCNIAIAKGDGCNTVTCVCGKQFSWSAEKETTERCQQFVLHYSEDTSVHCAVLLCDKATLGSELILAKAWQARHRIEVNRALKHWFKTKYWPCPNQACVVLSQDGVADGVRESIELWKQDNLAAVERCKIENDLALRSIFLNLYPVHSERPVFAHSIVMSARRGHITGSPDQKLIQSALKWIESNRSFYMKGIEESEVRAARQFLYLYGDRPVHSIKPSYIHCPGAFEWNRETSNPDLTFTNGNTTVERVGSISCYPAAFAKLPAEKAVFKVVVDAAPKSSNWLTFGVAMIGMPNSSSDGIGRTARTWGLSDDRSSSSSHCIVASSGSEVASFRKLQAGDILGAIIDVNEGWCEISVNENEFVHRFAIPTGTMDEYTFAMTFANDHRVSIIYEPLGMSKEAPKRNGELNTDHTAMFNSLKKNIKNILADSCDDDPHGHVPTSGLMTTGEKWLELCGNDDVSARDHYNELKSLLDCIFGGKRSSDAANLSSLIKKDSIFHNISWKTLLEAVSWYRHNRDRFKQEQKYHFALNFAQCFGEDAPFIAAYRAANRAEKSEMEEALAYMQFFSEEMNTWYDYDSKSSDPMIENIAKNCRCLPRHMRSCPRK